MLLFFVLVKLQRNEDDFNPEPKMSNKEMLEAIVGDKINTVNHEIADVNSASYRSTMIDHIVQGENTFRKAYDQITDTADIPQRELEIAKTFMKVFGPDLSQTRLSGMRRSRTGPLV